MKHKSIFANNQQSKLHCLSPRTSYTDRATTTKLASGIEPGPLDLKPGTLTTEAINILIPCWQN
jgi:hypothetical protein